MSQEEVDPHTVVNPGHMRDVAPSALGDQYGLRSPDRNKELHRNPTADHRSDPLEREYGMNTGSQESGIWTQLDFPTLHSPGVILDLWPQLA